MPPISYARRRGRRSTDAPPAGAHDEPNRSPPRFSKLFTMGARNGRAASRSTASRASSWNQLAGVKRWMFRLAIRCAASTQGRSRAS